MANKNKPQVDQMKRQVKKITIYHDVFLHNASGKKVLEDLMKVHFAMNTSFVPNDPMQTAFNEGQRNVLLRILTNINIDPMDYIKLIEEANRDED